MRAAFGPVLLGGVLIAPAFSLSMPARPAQPPPQISRGAGGTYERGLARTRVTRCVDRVRTKLETRMLALDLAQPENVQVFEAGAKVLRAFDDMASYLPEMPDEVLESMQGSVQGLERLSEFKKGLVPAPGGQEALYSGGGCTGYPGGQFAGQVGSLIADLIEDIQDEFDDEEEEEANLGGLPGTSNSQFYPAGIPGERKCKEFQALLELFGGFMPELSFSAGLIVEVTITLPNPLKILFDVLAFSNGQECIRAEALNAIGSDCEQLALATNLSSLSSNVDAQFQAQTQQHNSLQSRLDTLESNVMAHLTFQDQRHDDLVADVLASRALGTQEHQALMDALASSLTQTQAALAELDAKLEARAAEIKVLLDFVTVQNVQSMEQNCETLLLLHTPEGRRSSIIPTCATTAGFPFNWPENQQSVPTDFSASGAGSGKGGASER